MGRSVDRWERLNQLGSIRSMKLFTRYRILNAARAMVAEVGVERVTMRGIAAMANITAAAIYKHFLNKREMLEQVVKEGEGGTDGAGKAEAKVED